MEGVFGVLLPLLLVDNKDQSYSLDYRRELAEDMANLPYKLVDHHHKDFEKPQNCLPPPTIPTPPPSVSSTLS
jgi:hypothetical protein